LLASMYCPRRQQGVSCQNTTGDACCQGLVGPELKRCAEPTSASVAAGDETMIGKIATLATDTHTHKSTLQVRGCFSTGLQSVLAHCRSRL
jgi:hypothetical protein